MGLKIIDLPEVQIDELSWGEPLFSSFPPFNSLVSVLDPLRAFWSDVVSFKLAMLVLLPEPQILLRINARHSIGLHGHEVPGYQQEQLTQTFFVIFQPQIITVWMLNCHECINDYDTYILFQ